MSATIPGKLSGPAKFLIAGAVLAGVLLVGHTFYAPGLDRKLARLQSECAAAAPPPEIAELGGVFVCDPVALASSTYDRPQGVQRDLAQTQWERVQWHDGIAPVAFWFCILCCLPWAWYFLLRRIRELRDAVIGS